MGYADYTQGTGVGGIMLMRVADSAGQAGVINGNDIQFFLRTTNSSTFVGSPGFKTYWAANGSGWNEMGSLANYSNAADFRHMGTINIGNNTNVGFRIPSTGTQGFGGPTEMWVAVSRATVPPAPTPYAIDQVNHQDFRYMFNSAGDGGSPVREWQIGYGYTGSGIQWTAPSSGTITVGTFVVGARISIWSRGRNDVGWGPWSGEWQVDLRRGGRIKHQGTWYHMIPYCKYQGVWRASEPFGKIGKVPGVSDGQWVLASYTG